MNQPLRDLPLERFLPHNASSSSSDNIFAPNASGNVLKRPLSPSGQTPSAKRRLLSVDGHSGSSRTATPQSRYAPSVDFTAILNGPDSPVKKLDFSGISLSSSPSRQDDTEITPRPRVYAATSSIPSSGSSTDLLTRLDGPSSRSSSETHDPVATRSQQHHPLVFERIPRPPPPEPDPNSEHYPGFQVHADPHLVVARRDETKTLDEVVRYDEHPEKENSEPPRQIHGLFSSFDSTAKSSSMFLMSGAKGKTTMPHSSVLSVAHRRIFGVQGALEDTLDLTERSDYARQAALSSSLLGNDEDDGPFSRG